MSYVISYNLPQTSATGISLQTPKFETANYATTKDVSGDVQLTNIQSPIGLPEQFTFRTSSVSNIYKSSNVDPTLYMPSKRGIRLNTHVRQTWTVHDPDDLTAPSYAIPVTASLTLQVPVNNLLSTADVDQLILRLLCTLYPDNLSAVAKMLRNSLNPLR